MHFITTAFSNVSKKVQNATLKPLTAGAVHIRFLQFISAHYISAFKPVKDRK